VVHGRRTKMGKEKGRTLSLTTKQRKKRRKGFILRLHRRISLGGDFGKRKEKKRVSAVRSTVETRRKKKKILPHLLQPTPRGKREKRKFS